MIASREIRGLQIIEDLSTSFNVRFEIAIFPDRNIEPRWVVSVIGQRFPDRDLLSAVLDASEYLIANKKTL
jgi:hypothetical protein